MLEVFKNVKVSVSVKLAAKAGASGATLRDRIVQYLPDTVQKILCDTEKEGFEAQIRAVRAQLEKDQWQLQRSLIEQVQVTMVGKVDNAPCTVPAVFEPKA